MLVFGEVGFLQKSILGVRHGVFFPNGQGIHTDTVSFEGFQKNVYCFNKNLGSAGHFAHPFPASGRHIGQRMVGVKNHLNEYCIAFRFHGSPFSLSVSQDPENNM